MAHNLDLEDLHEKIKLALATKFPEFATVASYPRERKELELPALLVELEDMEVDPEHDAGTEQLPVVSKWAARVVLSKREAGLKLKIRKLAGALGVFIHRNRFGATVSPAKVTVIGPDAFDPDFDAQEVWTVEWDQNLDLGSNIWDGEGLTPDKVMIGWDPQTGPGNETAYSQLEPDQ